jgi:hypothetical protein
MLICVALLQLTGCMTLWSVKPVAVTVRDAETGHPLPATKITLDYGGESSALNKKNVTVWTDGFGAAQVPAGKRSAGASSSPKWEIEATHYINMTVYGTPGERVPPEIQPRIAAPTTSSTAPATAPSPPISAVSHAAATKRGDVADIRLYRAPVPSMTIIVGDKFRGRVVLHVVRSDEWIQDDHPGKRNFTFSPDADGLIEFSATPLLARELCRPFGYSAIRFETRSGRELDKDWASVTAALSHSRAAPDTVCARLISDKPRWEKGLWKETTSVYVIGTAEDTRAAATQP